MARTLNRLTFFIFVQIGAIVFQNQEPDKKTFFFLVGGVVTIKFIKRHLAVINSINVSISFPPFLIRLEFSPEKVDQHLTRN